MFRFFGGIGFLNHLSNHLSEEFSKFLNFYKLDPKMMRQQLIKIKQNLIAKNETIIASDIAKLIELIDLKHNFSSIYVKGEIK